MKILQVITRIYLNKEQLDTSVAFYEALFRQQRSVQERYPEIGIEAVQVGPVLLIAGEEQTLTSFKETQANLLVDSLAEWEDFLLQNGASLVDGPKQTSTGLEMRIRHPDGATMKYVQYAGSAYSR